MNTKHLSFITSSLLLLASGLFVLNTATAAPGTLANEPLQTSASAPPNLLFHLDTSGSMNHIVAEASSTDTCANDIVPDGTTVDLQISSGAPKIRIGGTNYDYGDTSDSTTRCFDPAGTYWSYLHTAGSSLGDRTSYPGAYLNWYFNTATDVPASTSWVSYKPGARTRLEVAQASLGSLLDSMTSVRVGLSTFDGELGADIDRQIADLDSTHLADMKTSINGAVASGYTPWPNHCGILAAILPIIKPAEIVVAAIT